MSRCTLVFLLAIAVYALVAGLYKLTDKWKGGQALMAKNFRITEGAGGPAPGIIHDTKGCAIYTPEQVEQIDQEGNRRKITGAEMEAMIGMVAAGNVMLHCAPVLYGHARHCGKLPQLKRIITTLRRLMTNLNMHVSVRQMGSICTQLENAHLSVSADMIPAAVNIPLHALLDICNRAMEQCDFCCTCTREESKTCELRRALELVPGVKSQGKEYARKYHDRCPYRGMGMVVEVEE